MSDDLVKRLHDLPAGLYRTEKICKDAAKRIKQLEAKLTKAAEALERSAEGWANALELNIIASQHRTAAGILRDEARQAIAELKGEDRG